MDGRCGFGTDSCYLELLIVVFCPHWGLLSRPSEKICLSVTHINGTISLKGWQSQIIHCNSPFEDLNASNWAFMTYKLYPPLSLSCSLSFKIFFLPLAFVFLPSRHAAEWHWASPCRGALLSHSSAHFRCPLSSSLQTMSFWLNTLSELLFCLLLF